MVIVPEKARDKLAQQKHREHAGDWLEVALRERQKRLVRAEKQQHLALKKKEPRPRQKAKHAGADDGGGEILVCLVVRLPASSARAEQNASADAGQKAKRIDDVPHRRDNGQRCRSVGPLILPDHRHIHHAVDAGDERAAKRGGQKFEIQLPDIAGQQIHRSIPPLNIEVTQKNTGQETGISACVLSGDRLLRTVRPQTNKGIIKAEAANVK